MEQLLLSAVRVRWQDGVLVLAVAGELDVLSAEMLDRELAALAAAGHSRIVLDVESLAFCDACGLRVLIRAQDRAVALGGWLRLVGATPGIRRVLRITRLTQVLPAFETLDDAMNAAAASALTAGSYGPADTEANVLPQTI